MTIVLKSQVIETPGGNKITLSYQMEKNGAPFWYVYGKRFCIAEMLWNKPNKRQIERYCEIADCNAGY